MIRSLIEQKVLSENERVAAGLRAALEAAGTLSLNFIGSPGAGKTAFLERTLQMLPQDTRAAVLTGDIQTENDADPSGTLWLSRAPDHDRRRLPSGRAHGARSTCEAGISASLDLLFIENVGNLVCPTSYDLGEDAKVVVLSVAEGEDKPLKYPGIFRKAELMILNKIDLLPYVPFKPELAREYARRIHPEIEII